MKITRTYPKANKVHECEWCSEPIERNTLYVNIKSMDDQFYPPTFHSSKWHGECFNVWAAQFKNRPPGTVLSFETHANERGKPPKEGTITIHEIQNS